MRRLFIALIRFYQRFLSPALGSHCRFEPSCSRYAIQAIERHGAIKGTLLGAWRILRCNPLSKAGQIDPIPPPGRWRPANELEPRRGEVEPHTKGSAKAGSPEPDRNHP